MSYYFVQKEMLSPGWSVVDSLTGIRFVGPFETEREAREKRKEHEARRAAREAVAAKRRKASRK